MSREKTKKLKEEYITNLDELRKLPIKPSIDCREDDYETSAGTGSYDGYVEIYTNVASHIRKILKKECIELERGYVVGGYIVSIEVRFERRHFKMRVDDGGRIRNGLPDVLS